MSYLEGGSSPVEKDARHYRDRLIPGYISFTPYEQRGSSREATGQESFYRAYQVSQDIGRFKELLSRPCREATAARKHAVFAIGENKAARITRGLFNPKLTDVYDRADNRIIPYTATILDADPVYKQGEEAILPGLELDFTAMTQEEQIARDRAKFEHGLTALQSLGVFDEFIIVTDTELSPEEVSRSSKIILPDIPDEFLRPPGYRHEHPQLYKFKTGITQIFKREK